MRAVELAQQVAIVLDLVGVVDVVVEQKAQNIRLAGLDHAAELVCREGVVAGEQDLPHRELVALLDLEDEIDAVVLGAIVCGSIRTWK